MTKSFNPKVSIVIPVYNGSNYLREAIDSALGQTYKNIEVIVINDGSNDGGKTDKICKSYGNKIRYFKKENGGVSSALNMGIEKMEGEYFSWLSHDDVYYPEKVEKQVKALSRLKDKSIVVYSGYEIIDKDGNHITQTDFESKHNIEDLNKPLYPFFHLILNGCSMLIHYTIFNKVGIFNEELSTTQDYDLWFRILKETNIYYDNNIVLKSRSHSGQTSKRSIDRHIKECNAFWLEVFSTMTKEKMTELEGSARDFYLNLYHSFKELTLYNEVIYFLLGKVLEESVNDYQNSSDKMFREEMLKSLSEEFFKYDTGRVIVKKILEYPKKNKKRIMFFTGNWHDRGGINRAISVVSGLLSKDYDPIVCYIKEEGNEQGYTLKEGVRFLELEESDFLSIPKILKLLEVDVFVGSNNCFLPLLNLYQEIEEMDIRVIMWNHEDYFWPFINKDIEKVIGQRERIYPLVSANIWLTNLSALVARQYMSNVFVLENPIGIKSNGQRNRKNNKFNIISVARFDSPGKRIDRLLKVFSMVVKEEPRAILHIVGKYNLDMKIDSSKSVKELLLELGIPENNIIFCGEVKDIENYYSKAAINIVSSEREGFGLSIIEAASFGIPSVAFDVGGPSEIISNEENGFIIENGDLEEMSKKVLDLLKDKELYEKISKASYEMSKKYNPEKVYIKWSALLKAITSEDDNLKKDFFEKESARLEKLSSRYLKEMVLTYESIIDFLKRNSEKSIEGGVLNIVQKKVKRLLELIRIQGLYVTLKNILLKLIKIIKS